tara:strand:- start:1037 stop:1795 length:759 start_codon:yes stop_codon:yes gene_type:complete
MAKKTTATQPKWEVKDRIYILNKSRTPVNYILRSRHHLNKPLQYFDGTITRSLRYASNQISVFEDEQYGDVTLPAIIFRDGKLIVPKEQVLLQQFLSIYHPDLNKEYEEFDPNKLAEAEIASEEEKLDAQNLVREMDIEDLEAIARVALDGSISDMTSKELRRDMLVYARKNPQEVMDLAQDENIKLRNLAVRAVEMGVIFIKDDNRTVCWNNKTKDKIVTVPYGENVYSALAAYFKTDDGLDVLQGITNKL